MEVPFLQQFCERFAQSTVSEYFTMLDARVSELFQSVGCSRGEYLPSNSVQGVLPEGRKGAEVGE